MKSLRYLYKYIKKYQILILGTIIFSLIFSFLSAAFLSLIQPLFDRIIFFSRVANAPQFTINTSSKSAALVCLLKYINSYLDFSDPITGLIQISVFIAVISLIKGLFYFLQYYFSSMTALYTVRNLRQDLYNHLWKLDLEYFSFEHTGSLLSRFTFDLLSIEQAISKGTRDLVLNLFLITVFLYILFGLDWKLTLVVLLFAPFIILPIIKMGNKMRTITKKIQNKMSDITVILQETITGVRIVRAFNMEEREFDKFKYENNEYLNFTKKAARITSLQVPVVETIFTLIAIGILGYGASRIIEDHLTSGEFFMYFGTLLSLTPHIGVVSRVYGIFQSGIAGMEKIISILETEPAVSDDIEPIEHTIEKEISYNNIYLSYEPEKPVLKNLNLIIKKGEMIAVVGPSGAGKTSMVDLLPRFYNPTHGNIQIDGIDIRKISLNCLRTQIGIVTQDTFMFHDTIENNIRYGKPDAALDEIKQAAEKAFALNYINKLSLGFQTVVGERGTQLSGGERQRLSIARVILKNPPILILDEATSSLDSESEKEVQKALNFLFNNRTTIVIAHRLSTIRNAQRIIMLDKGTVQDIGTHEELMKRSLLYKELYNLQFIK
ncbi:MAG: ABC transporter ATP-binding protein [Candidatus Firestonebacteria bacterium]|nr:ABC transporter ATP-binding protein [Candidatus Firestonebacteria bacterium]